MSKIAKGATKRTGSTSGAASNRKIVVPDRTLSSPALALVAVHLCITRIHQAAPDPWTTMDSLGMCDDYQLLYS
jgi:hypothetical protein